MASATTSDEPATNAASTVFRERIIVMSPRARPIGTAARPEGIPASEAFVPRPLGIFEICYCLVLVLSRPLLVACPWRVSGSSSNEQ